MLIMIHYDNDNDSYTHAAAAAGQPTSTHARGASLRFLIHHVAPTCWATHTFHIRLWIYMGH